MPTLHVSPRRAAPDFVQWLAAACLGWLGVGTFALILTPVPAHTVHAGWSPVFWLVLAPLCALAGLFLRGRGAARQRC